MTHGIEDIARRYYKAEAERNAPLGSTLFAVVMLTILAVLATATGGGAAISIGLVALGIALAGVTALVARRHLSRGLAAFRGGDPNAVRPVCALAMREFRTQIEAHRARTLGSESDWQIARGTVAEKADDAQRAVTYWRGRQRQEPDNEVAATQLSVARSIEQKLRTALSKLDAKADALLRFYNDCDAKLSLMDRYNRDMDESRRLEELSGSIDSAIAAAEGTLTAIGAQFVREAEAMGHALGGLARIQIESLAGEVPLDNIEHLADRIIASSDAQRRAVEDLDSALLTGYRRESASHV